MKPELLKMKVGDLPKDLMEELTAPVREIEPELAITSRTRLGTILALYQKSSPKHRRKMQKTMQKLEKEINVLSAGIFSRGSPPAAGPPSASTPRPATSGPATSTGQDLATIRYGALAEHDINRRRGARNTRDRRETERALGDIEQAVSRYTPGSSPSLANIMHLLGPYAHDWVALDMNPKLMLKVLEIVSMTRTKFDLLPDRADIEPGSRYSNDKFGVSLAIADVLKAAGEAFSNGNFCRKT